MSKKVFNLPAQQMKSGRAVVAAQKVPSFSATVAGVMIRRSPGPPCASIELSTSFLTVLRLRR